MLFSVRIRQSFPSSFTVYLLGHYISHYNNKNYTTNVIVTYLGMAAITDNKKYTVN